MRAYKLVRRIYCTSYCNQGHFLHDGRPVNHECVVLPPKALELERNDEHAQAQEVLASSPLHRHHGVKH